VGAQLGVVWNARAIAAAGLGALILGLSQPARSGEVGTVDQKCDLGPATTTCEWQPKSCSRPPPAPAFSMDSDVASYNAAVDRYNEYLREAQDYVQCIVKEGSADAGQAFPALVKRAIETKQREIQMNIQTAQRNMQMSRRGMGPTAPIISPSPRDDMTH
jgi:hypothetical protein